MAFEKITYQTDDTLTAEQVNAIQDAILETLAPIMKTFGTDVTVSDVYEGALGSLYVAGNKYGAFYGVNSYWAHTNYYLSPETRTLYNATNPSRLYTTKGTLTLTDSLGNVKQSLELDLCGNSNVRDEIIGTTHIKRWSDDFLFDKSLNWSKGTASQNYNLFLLEMTDSEFGKAPAKFTSSATANLVSNGFKTVPYDTVISGTAYSSVGMMWDNTNKVHKLAFRVNADYFSNPVQFAHEMGSKTSNMKLIFRYALAEPVISQLAISPVIVETGDTLTFTPTYDFIGYDANETAYSIKTIPYDCNIGVCGNVGAKVKGTYEQNLLLALVEQVLSGDSSGNTTVSEVRSGDDLTTQLQKEISELSQTGGTVYVKEGDYTQSGTITIPSNVTVNGLGKVIITAQSTSANVFELGCGGALKNVTIKTPLNFSGAAVLIGGDDVHYNEYSTSVSNIKVIGTTATDSNGATTTFTGKGIAVVANHVSNTYSTVYNACGDNIKVYNMEYGIYVYADMETDFIANTFFQNMYIENCHIGILDRGFTSAFIGYTIQTKPNCKYGVECYGGFYVGHVYDLDLYYDGDADRPNVGHPKIGYYLGGGQYAFISDPIFTEYQGKYGYEWDNVRAEKKLSYIDNTWGRYRTVNESIAPLKIDGTQCKHNERFVEFNGLTDNYLAFATDRWTVTTNITDSDIVQGSVADMFNPHLHKDDSIRLQNRTADNPYVITIDFGEDVMLSALGMDFDCIPKYCKMEAWNSTYETTRPSSIEFSDDNFLNVFERSDNRLSVVQSTWSGAGYSIASKVRFSFADTASVTEQPSGYVIVKNLYAYNACELAKTYLPSNGGHIYGNGKITVSASHTFTDDNELVSKKYVDDLFSSLQSQ